MSVLITGAYGSLGTALILALDEPYTATDLDTMDVTDRRSCFDVMRSIRPSLVYHLAAGKSAPAGEQSPERSLLVNGLGTANVVTAASHVGARVILASSCKAADPETAYGASKLIAERIVLNAGGWVARFYNVPESSGNVFRLWESVPEDEPIPVTACTRFFMTMTQAIDLLLWLPHQEPGRYAPVMGEPQKMRKVARLLYPGREQVLVAPRRGDRLIEPRWAQSEIGSPPRDGYVRILGRHDAAVSMVLA